MVYIAVVNNRPYAYKSIRVPGHKYPVKQYLGPAGDPDIVLLFGLQRIKKCVRKGIANALPTVWSAAGENQLVDAIVGELMSLVREVAPKTYERRPEYETRSET